MEQLPEIPIGLEDPRALASLDTLLELEDDALQKRREQKRCEHLRDLQKDVARDHARWPEKTGPAGTLREMWCWKDRLTKARLSVCQFGSTGVMSPEGG